MAAKGSTPVPMIAGAAAHQFAWTYQLLENSGLWVLQSLHAGAWQDMYAFTFEPHYLVDYEVGMKFPEGTRLNARVS